MTDANLVSSYNKNLLYFINFSSIIIIHASNLHEHLNIGFKQLNTIIQLEY